MSTKRDLSKVYFWCACAVLVFTYGVAVGRYQIFPYRVLKFGQESLATVFEERETVLGIRPRGLIKLARYDGNGVTRSTQGAAPGLTLLASIFDDANELRLIRLDGSVVRRWPVSFAEIFPNPKHIFPQSWVPQTDWNTHLHGAMALPDGSVVFNFEMNGLVKLDRCGVVQWTLPRMTHHVVERSEDGGFWVGGGRYITEKSTLPPIPAPFREDTILKVSDDGEVLAEISVPGLLLKNDMQGQLFSRMTGMVIPDNDLTHMNDIEELGSEMARHFPQFTAGDLLISIRQLNLVLVVDPDTEVVKWHQTGPWINQHDPDFQVDGRITVFSNNDDGTGDGSILGGSSILEVDPASGATTVKYGGTGDQRMYTANRGKHQRLENGNLLITESLAGRVFEVDANGDVVWEFINRYDDDHVAIVTEGIRYPQNYFDVSDWKCSESEALTRRRTP